MIPPGGIVDNAESYTELIDTLVELVKPLKNYNGATVLMAILGSDVDTDRLRELVYEAARSGTYGDACRTKAILQLNDAIHGFLDAELCGELEKEIEQ